MAMDSAASASDMQKNSFIQAMTVRVPSFSDAFAAIQQNAAARRYSIARL
jgi:hypothetical protein